MDVSDIVTGHYGSRDPVSMILSALEGIGLDPDHLGPGDLLPIDQLHAGGAPASQHLLDRLGVGPGVRVLDVGCGIGGPSRMAAMTGAEVTGIDLTPAFVDAATILTDRVGLGERTRFVATSGDELPFGDGTFDVAMMVHVGMNIPGKQEVFAEVHRVLAPDGLFGVYDQMRVREGDLPYPMPWAVDERSSFLETPEAYADQLTAAGFTVEEDEDRTASTAGPPPGGPVNQAAVFGPEFVERIGNNIAATRAGLLGAHLLLARA